jgi:hypothetical protein
MNTLERINRFARDLLVIIAVIYVLAGIVQGLADGWLNRFVDVLSRVLSP